MKKAIANTIRITEKMTGKMSGFASLSTSPLFNPLCVKRAANKDTVCAHCYSVRMQKMYSALEKKLRINSELLSGSILSADAFPVINTVTRAYKYFRLEAFGDLINETHAINYFTFCNMNPETRFTLWTKNPVFIHNAIKDGHKKPANLTVIYSSPYLNRAAKQCIFDIFPFIDKIFTVYTKEQAAADGVRINCGARKCADCLLCYAKNDTREINELLK